MKTITYKELDKIINEYKWSGYFTSFGTDVFIERLTDTDEQIEFGINWASNGASSIEEVQEFMNKMNEAKEICEELNERLSETILVWGD